MVKASETPNDGFLSEEKETQYPANELSPEHKDDAEQPVRARRPRIRIQRNAERPTRPERTSFRPEGFGQAFGNQDDRGQQRFDRPRYNRYGDNGRNEYQHSRPTYNRPRYNEQEGDEQPSYRRPRPYQPQAKDYRPRTPRPQQEGYPQRHPQGYRPRYGQEEHENGFRPYRNEEQQGYQPHGGYRRPQQRRPYRQHTADYDPNAKYSLKKRIEYREEHFDPNEPIRLNKFIANAGLCSRREADEYIQSGLITVNGVAVTELGTKVLRTDEVRYNGELVTLEKKVYVLLNKPKGYVTTSDDPEQRKTVLDLVKDACPERIYPVGRLDRNTTGVLLLTNDGDLASKLTHPKFLKKKIYHVFLDKNLTAHDLQQIAEGIELEDGEIHADAIEYVDEKDKTQVGLEIHSGKNRIVRRIFESLGYHVVKLDRVQFAGLTKKNVRRGDWRFLTEKEVDMLRMGAFE